MGHPVRGSDIAQTREGSDEVERRRAEPALRTTGGRPEREVSEVIIFWEDPPDFGLFCAVLFFNFFLLFLLCTTTRS
jgi:hypothetical protein